MIREAICTAPTIDGALDAACRELGLERGEVEFEIIDNPVKKKFGLFGGNPAKVRAYVVIPDKTPAQAAVEYLEGIFDAMGINPVEIQVEEKEDSAIITLSGEGLSCIIGHRGETLDSLQYLTGLVANRVNNDYYRITIDSGNFREKRENTLRALARRIAITAAKTGRSQSLEPMNPYERRIIHTTVHTVKGAISWSIGDDADRHVVIGPESKGDGYDAPRIEFNRNKGPRNQSKPGYRSRPYQSKSRDGSESGQRRRYPPKQHNQRTSRSDQNAKSQPKSDVSSNTLPLYGKIEPKK